jgi:hypothetical protein
MLEEERARRGAHDGDPQPEQGRDDEAAGGPLGFTGIGRVLGVTPNQVYMWATRRARNGFPEPVRYTQRGKNYQARPKGAPLFDVGEVRKWHDTYDPVQQKRDNLTRLRERGDVKGKVQ